MVGGDSYADRRLRGWVGGWVGGGGGRESYHPYARDFAFFY
jgi:hypothetical protein